MPQLDKFIFFNQYIWFTLFFFIFYVYILFIILPLIFKILKFRTKKVQSLEKSLDFKLKFYDLLEIKCFSFYDFSVLNYWNNNFNLLEEFYSFYFFNKFKS